MYTALRAASISIASLLRTHFFADPALGPWFDPGQGGTMDVSLHTPLELSQPSGATGGGLSVWLYRVVRDEQQLNMPPRRLSPTAEQRAPLPLRLHYLMTPIVSVQSGSPELEQSILGKVLQTLHDRPILAGSDLRDDLAGSQARLHVRLETQALGDLAEVWEAIDRSYQLSVSYEVSLALIDSAEAVIPVTPVQQVITEEGVATPITP